MYYNTNKLKELRQQHKLSQEEVAKAIHIGQTAYSAIETGHTKVEIDRLLAIATYYKVNPTDLVDNSTLVMNFNEKVENGYASYIETLNIEHKELLDALKKQLDIKDEQMAVLLKIISEKK